MEVAAEVPSEGVLYNNRAGYANNVYGMTFDISPALGQLS